MPPQDPNDRRRPPRPPNGASPDGLTGALVKGVRAAAADRKEAATDLMVDFAGSLRRAATSFDETVPVKGLLDAAADGFDDLASELDRRTIEDLYLDVTVFAGRHPVGLALGAALVGLAMTRFAREMHARVEEGRDGRE